MDQWNMKTRKSFLIIMRFYGTDGASTSTAAEPLFIENTCEEATGSNNSSIAAHSKALCILTPPILWSASLLIGWEGIGSSASGKLPTTHGILSRRLRSLKAPATSLAQICNKISLWNAKDLQNNLNEPVKTFRGLGNELVALMFEIGRAISRSSEVCQWPPSSSLLWHSLKINFCNRLIVHLSFYARI